MKEIKKHPFGWWNDKQHCINECKKWKTLAALRENQSGCLKSIDLYGYIRKDSDYATF